MRNKPMLAKLAIAAALFLCHACVAGNPQQEPVCSGSPVYRSIDTFHPVQESAFALADRFGPEHVLLVLDIDNTLLAMNQGLGSDQWFNWQFELLLEDPQSPELFISSLPELLEAQRLLYDVSAMSRVEEEQPAILKTLQQKGLSKIMLTSRGPEMRDSTLRELQRNGYALDPENLITNRPRRYFPYSIDNPAASGMGMAELRKYRLLWDKAECQNPPLDLEHCLIPPELISFQNGLYMTSGQHKGLMLKMLLEQSGLLDRNRLKAILFVDDTRKHILDMHDALCDSGIALTLLHYTHEEPKVKRFLNSDKSHLRKRWQHLLKAIHPFQ